MCTRKKIVGQQNVNVKMALASVKKTNLQNDLKKISSQFARYNRKVGPDNKKYTITSIGYRDLSTQLNFWKTNATAKLS